MGIIVRLSRLLAWPLVVLVWVYQKTLSPDHSWVRMFYPYGYCKYYPSCSEYTVIVLRKQGLIGLPKILKRVASCNPRSMGGVDWP